MAALATAFACVWFTVALYVGWLGRNQRRLSARVHELSSLVAASKQEATSNRRAA
jgi:CcmD family protein